MRYFFYLDETGDHGLDFIDKNFPLFLLCGCLIREDNLRILEEEVQDFKHKYFKTDKVILHSRDIRKCQASFQILFDLELKARFYKDLNSIIEKTTFHIIGAGINKENHVKRYGLGAKDPYALSLSFIIERLIFCLDKLDAEATVEIIIEERGKKEDRLLLSHFNSTMDKGTYYVSSERLKNKVVKFEYYAKKDNITGLQVADLCAYPLARNILYPEVPYLSFDIIKSKIYCSEKGEYVGWGLKIFP
jgi:hypothetical protein